MASKRLFEKVGSGSALIAGRDGSKGVLLACRGEAVVAVECGKWPIQDML